MKKQDMRVSPSSCRSSERGVAAVEFALVASLLITLLLGAAEFGRAVYQYNTVVKGVRSAVRHLSNLDAGNTTEISIAKNLVVYGSKTAGSTPVVPGLTTAMVTVNDASNSPANTLQPTGAGVINLVSIEVANLRFQPLASFILPAFTFGPISATMRQGL